MFKALNKVRRYDRRINQGQSRSTIRQIWIPSILKNGGEQRFETCQDHSIRLSSIKALGRDGSWTYIIRFLYAKR